MQYIIHIYSVMIKEKEEVVMLLFYIYLHPSIRD
jgi:hypothetical protein